MTQTARTSTGNMPPTPPDSWNTIPGKFAIGATYLNHAAILLPNGRVLVAGGSGSSPKLTQIFDPNSNTWNKAADLNFVHPFDPTGILLLNETVLLVGSTQQAEIYDPNVDAWTPTTPMNALRSGQTTTRLRDGRVLVAGGDTTGPTAELFDPTTGKWTPTNPMNAIRASHTATLLPNGQVLVAGGGASQAGQSLVAGGGTSAAGPTGQVPVAGGSSISTAAELFDPSAGTWTSIASPMNAIRVSHTATLLPNGQVLVAGGDTTGPTAELFDPTTGNWTPTGSMTAARLQHTATLLSNGYVLVAGGGNPGSEIASAELYLPISNTWMPVTSMNIPRTNHTATLLYDNRVLIVGGSGSIMTIAGDNDIMRSVPGDTMLLTSDGKTISTKITSSGGSKTTLSTPTAVSAGQSEEYYTPSQYQGEQADLAALNGTVKQLNNTISSLGQTLNKAQQAVRWGFINADGTVATGSGNFSVKLEPTVKIAFDITFQPPFSSTPSIVAQAIIPPTPGSIPSFLPGVLTSTVVYVDKNWCRVQVSVVDPPGQGRALPFMFIATGS